MANNEIPKWPFRKDNVVSKGNKLVDSFIYGIDDATDEVVSRDNKLVNSDFGPLEQEHEETSGLQSEEM